MGLCDNAKALRSHTADALTGDAQHNTDQWADDEMSEEDELFSSEGDEVESAPASFLKTRVFEPGFPPVLQLETQYAELGGTGRTRALQTPSHAVRSAQDSHLDDRNDFSSTSTLGKEESTPPDEASSEIQSITDDEDPVECTVRSRSSSSDVALWPGGLGWEEKPFGHRQLAKVH